jgi:ADP-ribose pyrophosphatase YjhB (NUDIX family)
MGIGGNHFIEGKYTPRSFRLSNKLYGEILDNIVVACVDVLIINAKGQILLGHRSQDPLRGWWLIGGRMLPGESLQEAACRKLREEIALTVCPSDVSVVSVNSFLFDKRAQAPIDHGCHMLQVLTTVKVGQPQGKLIAEYSELGWFNPQEVCQNKTGCFHPFLIKILNDLGLA